MDDSWEEWDGIIQIDDDQPQYNVDTNEFIYQNPYQNCHIYYNEPANSNINVKKPFRILKRNPSDHGNNTPIIQENNSPHEDINLESKYQEKSKSYEELKRKIFEGTN